MAATAQSLADLIAAIGRASGGRLAATIQGSADIRVDGLAPLGAAGATDLAFLANQRYRNDALATRAAAVVLSPESARQLSAAGQRLPALVIVDQPYAWFAHAAQLLHPAEPVNPGVAAAATVDRGTMGDTVIEDGVKLDNQIQVAHNCFIGAHTVIAGCVGIAGSARIGRGCQIGGAAMIAGHLTIADGCAIGPGTLVASSLTEPGHYTGFFPLMKNRDWERAAAIIRNLDDLRDRLRQLESQQRQGKQS